MNKKPHDLLEFLRRASDPEEEPPVADVPPPAEAPPSRRMVLVRPSQVWIAAAGAALLALLAFLLGLAVGGGSEAEDQPAATTGVWVVRVMSFSNTEQGKINAKMVMGQLAQKGLHETILQEIPSQKVVVVALGSWLTNPKDNREARAVLDQVRGIKDVNGATPFHDAKFWLIQR